MNEGTLSAPTQRVVREVTYTFNGSEERHSSDVEEMRRVVQQLITPKTTLTTNLNGWSGYLDFHVLEGSRIQMEIMERDNYFATIDLPTAARVLEIAMTDTRTIPLRQKLSGLPIDWLT
jgi:hypothetical protein